MTLTSKIASAGRRRQSPSQEAAPSRLRWTQIPDGEDPIYNGRPIDLTGVPITIYHPAFSTFLRVWNGDDELEQHEIACARSFVRACAGIYESDADRVIALDKSGIPDSVHDTILTQITLRLSPNKKIEPDGVVRATVGLGIPRPLICITQVKSEIGQGGCDPNDQSQQCYKAFYCSDKGKPFRDVSCCSCLTLAVAGPHIMVGGAVFADTLLAQSLTDYIYVGPRCTLENGSQFHDAIRRVARLFRALKMAIAELDEYYVSLSRRLVIQRPSRGEPGRRPGSAHTQSRASQPAYPYIGPHLLELRPETGGRIVLEYTNRLMAYDPRKAAFTARARRDHEGVASDVVVKFAHRYCEEAHRLLAEQEEPLAPRLWFCEKVESVGMYVVVMDYIKDEGDRETMTVEELAQLTKAVRLLHEQNLVHGDLRQANILLRQGRGPMLVDFDWCGKEGTARYPYDIDMSDDIGWHEEVEGGELIKKEHDLHMLNLLVGDDGREEPAGEDVAGGSNV
ncbi:hypothetical protein OH77DRAFT_931829 [Trametes cingulata]|nr:hypothetical protein OH77DRAFT_931829 [Trametes cingulata]